MTQLALQSIGSSESFLGTDYRIHASAIFKTRIGYWIPEAVHGGGVRWRTFGFNSRTAAGIATGVNTERDSVEFVQAATSALTEDLAHKLHESVRRHPQRRHEIPHADEIEWTVGQLRKQIDDCVGVV